MRVLCVEDEAMLREDIAEYLRLQHYEVDEAETGEEAIDRLNRTNYDLVLCDIKMPRMDGYELLRQVRSDDGMVATPFLFLSALNERDDKIHAYEKGCDGYLTKPIDFSVLEATVRSYVTRQRARDFLLNGAADSSQRHIVAMFDDTLSGPLSDACLLVQYLSDAHRGLLPEETSNYLILLQDKLAAHISGMHLFHGALCMQLAKMELLSEWMLVDDLIRLSVEQCCAINSATTITYRAPAFSGGRICGEMRMLQQALSGLISMVPETRFSDEVIHYIVRDGICILTVCDAPEMAMETQYLPVSEATNLAQLSLATRERLAVLAYALQAAQAHNGRLELLIWPEGKFAARMVLPQTASPVSTSA